MVVSAATRESLAVTAIAATRGAETSDCRSQSRPQLRHKGVWMFALLTSLTLGCTRLDTSDGSGASWRLPRPQMSPDSVVLEVVTLRLPAGSDKIEQLWQEVDEQHWPREARQAWLENGFRCGVISGQLPADFQQILSDQRAARADLDRDSSAGPSIAGGEQRLQNRAGKRGKILTTEVRDSLIVLLPQNGRLSGQTLVRAQCLFSVRPLPQGSGTILELTPEIEHGEPRQRWIGQAHEGSFRLDMNRDRLVVETLRTQPNLQPGQTLVISCVTEPKGLGRQFFAETASGVLEHRFLLIRLAQTQLDDLFTPESHEEPLTSLVD